MYVPRIHCWNKVVLKRPCCLTSWVYITSNILQVRSNSSLLKYKRINKMDLISHLAGNKNCDNEGNLNL